MFAAVLGHVRRLPAFASRPALALARAVPRADRARRTAHVLGGANDAERLVRLVEISDHDLRTRLIGTAGAGEFAGGCVAACI